MAKYRVFFQSTLSSSVVVDVPDDSEDPQYDATELGFENLPGSICAQCSGWGQNYSVDQSDWDLEMRQEKDDKGNWVEVEASPELITESE